MLQSCCKETLISTILGYLICSILIAQAVAFQKGAIGTLHSHSHIQLTFVQSGVFEVEINQEKMILRQGDVFHVPSGIIHGVVCLNDGELIDVFSPYREAFPVIVEQIFSY